jgi:hypothetical protein
VTPTSINNPTIRASIASGPALFALTPAQTCLYPTTAAKPKARTHFQYNFIQHTCARVSKIKEG